MLTIPPGVYAISPTPFRDDGSIDPDDIDRIVDFELGAGVRGLTILGMMGEAQKLTEEERRSVIERFLRRVDGRIPVVVGASAPGTDPAIRYGLLAEALGATALLLAPPTNLRDIDSVREYYRRVHDATSIQIVVQDEPVYTGVVMSPTFLASITDEFPRARAIKLEELPSPVKVESVLRMVNQPVSVFGGAGGVYFYEELLRGAVGTMTGFAFPEALVAIYDAFVSGRLAAAREVFYRYLPLVRYEGQPIIGLTIRKEILRRRGVISSAAVRHPGPRLDAATQIELDELLAAIDPIQPGTTSTASARFRL